ncbi:MAG TPA: hypothetical protein VKG92_01915, partial [Flavobacteriales bacterium]|nr:hypothetical protein [Flavobacteriales bacterium]
PDAPGGAPMLVVGSAQVEQQDDSNWMTLVIRHVRDGQVIDERFVGSVPQTRVYNEWNKVAVALAPRRSPRPGDRFLFMALPYGPDPPLLVDDMEFWVVR